MKDIEKLNFRPFTKFCMSIGAVPSSYLAGLTIEEQLLWLCSYLEKEVIPVVNNNSEVVEELKTYVEHYFDNLDVQEEINNKLDAMAEDGTLEEIIASYLNTKAVICFDTVSEMKDSTNLINGSYARTLGYYEKNDKGGATYKIREVTNDDDVDEMFIIALNDEDNILVAELIVTNTLNVKQLGIHEDNSTDDSDLLQSAINKCNTLNVELQGNYEPLIITKSIYIPTNSKIDNIIFATSSPVGNFTNGYMIGINTENMSSWTQSYPVQYRGYFTNCQINNNTQSNLVNGIFCADNCLFENLRFYQLNTSFKMSLNYLDCVRMKNVFISTKVGTNYALDLGYLGDQCSFDSIQMAGTVGTPNFCSCGKGHNPITFSNIIGNGKWYIYDSIVNINGTHNELIASNQFEINNAQVTIENGYFYKVTAEDDYNITVSSQGALTLKNCLICYQEYLYSYNTATDVDINVSANSVLTLINSYKAIIVSGNVSKKNKSPIKTNLDTQPSLKNIREYNNSKNANDSAISNWAIETVDATSFAANSDIKWFLPSGTYYYKIVPLIDANRMISAAWSKAPSITLTNGSSGAAWASASSNIWRIYRGTTEDSYDSYVDIANVNTLIEDNGYMCNGYKWQSRTAGVSDTFNTGLLSLTRPTKENVIITGDFTNTPTVGSWKRGDIIYSIHAGVTGWICTAAGTPGTWKAL